MIDQHGDFQGGALASLKLPRWTSRVQIPSPAPKAVEIARSRKPKSRNPTETLPRLDGRALTCHAVSMTDLNGVAIVPGCTRLYKTTKSGRVTWRIRRVSTIEGVLIHFDGAPDLNPANPPSDPPRTPLRYTSDAVRQRLLIVLDSGEPDTILGPGGDDVA
jgi:hypothetical protein